MLIIIFFLSFQKRQRTECSSSDSDSDIDLSVDLKPMDHYVKQRHNMVDEMFSAISSRKLKNMLPAILQVSRGVWGIDVHCT